MDYDKNLSIWEQDPYDLAQYEVKLETETENGEEATTQSIAPNEEVASMIKEVTVVNQTTTKSQDIVTDIREMTIKILEKVSIVEAKVNNNKEDNFEIVDKVNQMEETSRNQNVEKWKRKRPTRKRWKQLLLHLDTNALKITYFPIENENPEFGVKTGNKWGKNFTY